jgi:hypothetical protein
MYYTIYKTTNLINGRFYIGMHKTNNPNDDYLGSGNLLDLAIQKHGKHNFKKEILEYCNDEEHMCQREEQIINEKFLIENKHICYNIALGGLGGFKFLKDSKEYKNWYDKNKNSMPNLKPKDSLEYINWRIKKDQHSVFNLPHNDIRYISWYDNFTSSRPNKSSINSKKYMDWYNKFIISNPASMDKNSEKYKQWFINQQSSCIHNMSKDSEEYKQWFVNQQSSLPSNMPKDSKEYKNWYDKNKNSMPNLKPKNSQDYINWKNKLPSNLPLTDPKRIDWSRKCRESKINSIRIYNHLLGKGKMVKKDVLTEYLLNGWIVGMGPRKKINKHNDDGE